MHTKKTRGGKKLYQEASDLLKKEKKSIGRIFTNWKSYKNHYLVN